MKFVSFLIPFLLCCIGLNAQSQLRNARTENHLIISGTSISMVPPEGFIPSSHYLGFQDAASGSSIIINQIPARYLTFKNSFSDTYLRPKRIELIEKSRIMINDMESTLLKVSQYSPAHNYTFLKYILILDMGADNSLLINASFPESKKEQMDTIIKNAVLSVFVDKSAQWEKSVGLDFTVDLSKTKFKQMKSISGTIFLNIGKEGMMIIAKSIRPVDFSDKKGASINILKAISNVSYRNLESSKNIIIDDCDGYQVVANVLVSGKKQQAVQTVLFGENYYYNFTMIVPSVSVEFTTDYEYILNSFKRK